MPQSSTSQLKRQEHRTVKCYARRHSVFIPRLPLWVSCESLSFLFTHHYKNCQFFCPKIPYTCFNDEFWSDYGTHYISHLHTDLLAEARLFRLSQPSLHKQETGHSEVAIHSLICSIDTYEMLSDRDPPVKAWKRGNYRTILVSILPRVIATQEGRLSRGSGL